MDTKPILRRSHFLLLTVAFLLFVIYGSFVPLNYQPINLDAAQAKFASRMARGINFDMRSDWAANVLLFVPLGFLAMGWLTVDRPKPIFGLLLVPFFALLSGLIEYGQIWFPPRDTNLNDIVAETIGGSIGVVGWLTFGQSLTQRLRDFLSEYGPSDWAIRVLPAYVLFVIFTHGMPFDLTMSPGLVWHKMKRQLDEREIREGYAMVATVPPAITVPEKTLMTVAYFVPIGALMAFLPGTYWQQRRRFPIVFAFGLLFASCVEGLQLIVMSCSAFASDIAVATCCIIIGWLFATRQTTLSRGFWFGLAGAWTVALAIVSWLPFAPPHFPLNDWTSHFEWMPFREYIDTNYLNGMNKILHRSVAFVPVGYLLNRAICQRSAYMGIIGALLGMVIEFGQFRLTDHTASVTDMILGSLGAWCGGIIANRSPKNRPTPQISKPKDDIPAFRLL